MDAYPDTKSHRMATGQLDWQKSADEGSDGYCEALVAERADGSEGWSAYPPDGDKDVWVAVCIDGGTVLANSYSG